MNQFFKYLIMSFGTAGLAFSSTVNWQLGSLGEPVASKEETLAEDPELVVLDLNIHSQEVFQEARKDLHDQK